MNVSKQTHAEQAAILRELYAVLDKLEAFVKVHAVPEGTELIDLAIRLRDSTTRVLASPGRNPPNPPQA